MTHANTAPRNLFAFGFVDAHNPNPFGGKPLNRERPSQDQIDICKNWLKINATPAKSWACGTSYGFKHQVERATGAYVTNGAFIQAAIELGYEWRREKYRRRRFSGDQVGELSGSPNARIKLRLGAVADILRHCALINFINRPVIEEEGAGSLQQKMAAEFGYLLAARPSGRHTEYTSGFDPYKRYCLFHRRPLVIMYFNKNSCELEISAHPMQRPIEADLGGFTTDEIMKITRMVCDHGVYRGPRGSSAFLRYNRIPYEKAHTLAIDIFKELLGISRKSAALGCFLRGRVEDSNDSA